FFLLVQISRFEVCRSFMECAAGKRHYAFSFGTKRVFAMTTRRRQDTDNTNHVNHSNHSNQRFRQ
ncbi:MAG: hypothetical protein LBQ74_15015, partial [Prevotella sp.]|nr:hypothetical protein [Prevotella sp.]